LPNDTQLKLRKGEDFMRFIKQFMIILAISFIGEALHSIVPLPVPASIYGLVIVLIALQTGALRLNQIKMAALLLIDIMPIMFIPAAAGLIVVWPDLRPVVIPFAIITVVSTIVVMGVSGGVTQFVRKFIKNKEAK